MLYWPFWKQDAMPNDRYGTVGTGLGAGTGAVTVQVRYGYGYGTGTIHGYGRYGTWVRYMGTFFVPMYRAHVPYPCTVPMYRTDRTHVSYPYRTRTCTVPAPVPAPKPVPTVPYPSKLLSKNPSAPYVMNPIENRVFIALEIS